MAWDPLSALSGAVDSVFSFGQSFVDRKNLKDQIGFEKWMEEEENRDREDEQAYSEKQRAELTRALIIVFALMLFGMIMIILAKKKK